MVVRLYENWPEDFERILTVVEMTFSKTINNGYCRQEPGDQSTLTASPLLTGRYFDIYIIETTMKVSE